MFNHEERSKGVEDAVLAAATIEPMTAIRPSLTQGCMVSDSVQHSNGLVDGASRGSTFEYCAHARMRGASQAIQEYVPRVLMCAHARTEPSQGRRASYKFERVNSGLTRTLQ